MFSSICHLQKLLKRQFWPVRRKRQGYLKSSTICLTQDHMCFVELRTKMEALAEKDGWQVKETPAMPSSEVPDKAKAHSGSIFVNFTEQRFFKGARRSDWMIVYRES